MTNDTPDESPEARVARLEAEAREAIGRWELILMHEARQQVGALEDDQLKQAVIEMTRTIDVFAGRGDGQVAGCLRRLGEPLLSELTRRASMLENARQAVEANGHEVRIGYDEVSVQQGEGDGWDAHCSCEGLDYGSSVTYDEAVRAAGEHAAEHGGRWAEGHPCPPDDYH